MGGGLFSTDCSFLFTILRPSPLAEVMGVGGEVSLKGRKRAKLGQQGNGMTKQVCDLDTTFVRGYGPVGIARSKRLL